MHYEKPFSTYSKLNRSIYTIFICRIICSMGNFIFPLLSIFLTNNRSIGGYTSGVLLTVAAVAYVPCALIGGKLADSIGRKKVIVLFQTLTILCFVPCIYFKHSIYTAYMLIFAFATQAGAQVGCNALVIDLTNVADRKTAYSLLYLGNNINMAVAFIIIGYLFNDNIGLVFVLCLVCLLIGLLIITFKIEETMPGKNLNLMDMIKKTMSVHINDETIKQLFSKYEKAEKGSVIKALIKRPELLTFALVSTIYSFVYIQNTISIPLQIKDIFGQDSAKICSNIVTTNAVTVIIMTTFLTELTQKLSALFNVTVAGIFFAIGFGMLFFVNNYYLILLSTVIWTFGEIFKNVNSDAYIANHTPITHRARFNAIIPIIIGSGYALGPMITGAFIKKFNISMVWPLIFVLAIFSSIFMYILYLNEKRNRNCIDN